MVLFAVFVVAVNVTFLLWTISILHPGAAECLRKVGTEIERCRAAAASSARFVAGLVVMFWVGADAALTLLYLYVLLDRDLRSEEAFGVP